jgi:hypothetical protein
VAVDEANEAVFELLLSAGADLEAKTSEGFPPLWLALRGHARNLSGAGFAAKLIQSGASPNVVRRTCIKCAKKIKVKTTRQDVVSYLKIAFLFWI